MVRGRQGGVLLGVVLALVAAVALVVSLRPGDAPPSSSTPAPTAATAVEATDPGALSPFEKPDNRLLDRCTPGAAVLASCGQAPRLRGTQRWFNTPDGRPLTLAGLRGRVVLVDFFAYSCINCERDQPYVQRWYDAYHSAGLDVIGIHAPQFAFERSARRLAANLREQGTTYPVVQDNDMDTWNAYRNRYWPAKYLIGPDGVVGAITFGEGGYDRTERLIREELTRRDPDVRLPAPVTPVDVDRLPTGTSRELYLGPHNTGYVGTPGFIDEGVDSYNLATEQPEGTFSLGGSWTGGLKSITSGPGARIRLHYRARDVYTVLDGEGTVTVSQPGTPDRQIAVGGTRNLYPLVESDTMSESTIELSYSPGISAYTFTFG